MSRNGYSHLGTAFLIHDAQRARGQVQPHTTGWTPPTSIYEKMRAIDASARELDALVQVNIRRPEWKTAWNAWMERWKAFFAKYQSDFAKFGALFYTDDLMRQTEEHRRILEDFHRGYLAERDEKGNPLPSPITPVPLPPPPPEKKEESEGFKVPWWAWVLGGAVLVVGGYYFFKQARATAADLKAKHRALEGVLPRMLPGGVGQAAATHAHDPAAFITSQTVIAEPRDLPQIMRLP